ncbi:MAG: hydroxyphenylacetyl-CoA thioesterase PaaI [Rhodospirillales bacterium]|nr:hydroxyphenylacetyl-CoA thioesterase PaaI [Rhodospirillales bacterium]
MSETVPQQDTAEAVGRVIEEGDLLAKTLGIELQEIRPGYARATMTVRDDMSNAADIGHGGATFTLADTVFAYACNSHDRMALATNCSITFTGAVEIGDVLSAEGREVSLHGRNGVYDITVRNQQGDTVALFRGQSRQVSGSITNQQKEKDAPA